MADTSWSILLFHISTEDFVTNVIFFFPLCLFLSFFFFFLSYLLFRFSFPFKDLPPSTYLRSIACDANFFYFLYLAVGIERHYTNYGTIMH